MIPLNPSTSNETALSNINYDETPKIPENLLSFEDIILANEKNSLNELKKMREKFPHNPKSSVTYPVPDKIEIISNSCLEGYEGKDKGCFRDFLKHETYNLTVKEIIERSSNVGTILATQSADINDIELFLKIFFKSIWLKLKSEKR